MTDAFRDRYGPFALVIGASEGLGAAWADALARRGLGVVLVARRLDRLEAFAAELRARHGVEVVAASVDVGADDATARIDEAVGGREVGLVVYNACASFVGPFLSLTPEQREATIDVNVRGVSRVSATWGERLTARGRGGLVLMSSMSGFQGTAYVGIYAATKAFDLVLGEALWEELGPKGVDVLVVVAGATLTPNFMAVTPERRRKDALPMAPEAVVEEALATLGRGGPTMVPGTVNKLAAVVFGRLLSRRRAVRFLSSTTRRMYGGEGA